MHVHEQRSTPAALLDYPGAQQYLGGISRSTLKLLVSNGSLRSVHIGRRRMISIAALDEYIAAQTTAKDAA